MDDATGGMVRVRRSPGFRLSFTGAGRLSRSAAAIEATRGLARATESATAGARDPSSRAALKTSYPE